MLIPFLFLLAETIAPPVGPAPFRQPQLAAAHG